MSRRLMEMAALLGASIPKTDLPPPGFEFSHRPRAPRPRTKPEIPLDDLEAARALPKRERKRRIAELKEKYRRKWTS